MQEKNTPAPPALDGHARRALLTAEIFAFFYTLWGFFAGYYFPRAMNEGRLPVLARFGMLALAGAVFLVFFLLSRRSGSVLAPLRRELFSFLRSGIFWIGAIWFLWACIAAALAIREDYVTITHVSSYLLDQLVNFLILFPLGYSLARQRNHRLLTAIAAVCFLGFLPYALGGIREYFSRTPFSILGRVIEYDEDNRIRLGTNPNSCGMIAAMALSAGLYLLGKTRRLGLRALWIAMTALIYWAVLLTGSRGSIGAASLGLVYFAAVPWLSRLPNGKRRIPRAVFILGGAVLFLLLLAGLGWFLVKVSGRELGNGTGRFDIWQYIIHKTTEDTHIFLHGVSSASLPFVIGEAFGKSYWHAHNQILGVWFAQGTPALLLFLAFLIVLARRCLQLSFLDGERSWGDRGAVLLVLVLFANSMVEMPLVDMKTSQGCLFCLAAGAVCGMASLLPKKERTPQN